MTKRIVYLDEAADILGLTKEALRKRIQRGSIEAKKDMAGRWLITLPDNVQDDGGGRGQAEKDAIIKVLQVQIDELRDDKLFLRQELERRSEELAWANMERLQLKKQVQLLLEDGRQKSRWPFKGR